MSRISRYLLLVYREMSVGSIGEGRGCSRLLIERLAIYSHPISNVPPLLLEELRDFVISTSAVRISDHFVISPVLLCNFATPFTIRV